MQPTQAHLRPVSAGTDLRPATAFDQAEPEFASPGPAPRRRLTTVQCLGGFVVFLAWLALFGAGIMVDTSPYRSAISASGERLLRLEGQPAGEEGIATGASNDAATQPAGFRTPGPIESWLVVLFCFLPLNLAWLCVAASTLGAVGNLANLSDDGDTKGPRDTSNPLTSAVLRGFFVYLFLMSGLLLLDHTPFSNAGPSQYIRLAGFLSLFSFVVSYHPHLFGALIVSAFERIQVRAGDSNGSSSTVQHTSVKALEIESTAAAPVQADGVPGRRDG